MERTKQIDLGVESQSQNLEFKNAATSIQRTLYSNGTALDRQPMFSTIQTSELETGVKEPEIVDDSLESNNRIVSSYVISLTSCNSLLII